MAGRVTRRQRIGKWAALVALAAGLGSSGCAPPERVTLIHPERGPAARAVFSVAFTQQITLPDQWVYLPDEFSGAAVDHHRGLIYVGGRGGTLLALDEFDGTVVWERPLGGVLSSKPIIHDRDRLLFGTDDGAMVVFDLETQTPRWSYETDGTVRNPPVVRDGVVYFVNSRDQVYALDLESGAWRWQYERERPSDFTIHGRAGLSYLDAAGALSSGLLYTGFDDGRVVSLDASSGEALAVANLAPPAGAEFVDVDSTPVVDEAHQQVLVTSQAVGVHALDLVELTERWSLPVRGAGELAAGPADTFVVGSSLDGIYGFDAHGRVRWHQQVDPGVLSDPVVVEDTVFFTHSEIGLLAFDVRSGEYLARLDVGSGMSSQPVYDPEGRRFYAISNRGQLFAFRLAETR